VLGPVPVELQDQLPGAPTWPARFTLLDTALSGVLRGCAEVEPEVRYAWRRVLRTNGTVPVSTLAREVGWNERHLAGRVEAGLTPKVAARVGRC